MATETLQTSARSETEKSVAVPLHERAEDNLRYIREAMEGASSFTSISGIGLAGAGLTGLAASLLQERLSEPGSPGEILLWLAALGLAFAFSTGMTVRKAYQQGTSLWSASGRKLLYAFTPTMLAGGVITLYVLVTPASLALPPFWLTLYGAAIMTAGAYSVALIRLMGAVFILLGVMAFFTPLPDRWLMGAGFGIVHVVAGIIIWKHHGG